MKKGRLKAPLRSLVTPRRPHTSAPAYQRSGLPARRFTSAEGYERAITALKRRENAAGSSIGLPSAINA